MKYLDDDCFASLIHPGKYSRLISETRPRVFFSSVQWLAIGRKTTCMLDCSCPPPPRSPTSRERTGELDAAVSTPRCDGEDSLLKRVLAKQYHPDRHIGEESSKESATCFQAVAEAYSTLSNPDLRMRYDAMQGTPAVQPPQ